MATLTIPDQVARNIYPTADPALKTILENSFTKEFFSVKITDRVKTFEDACAVLDINVQNVFDENVDEADDIAYKKLKVIIQALNEEWTPDWNNSSQQKWYPWFNMNPSGFSLYDVGYDFTHSTVGSRLCFRSAELAKYAATQFIYLYKSFFTI